MKAKSFFVDSWEGSAQKITCREVQLQPLDKNGVLVKVKACGLLNSQLEYAAVSHILFKTNNNKYFPVGYDVAGIVAGVGSDVTTVTKGDHVVGIIPVDYDQSSCSDYVVLQEFDIVLKPERVSFVDAAGCISDAVKSYIALHYLGKMTSDSTVLVLDGASSFGSICIQLARHWGAKVLSTCSSEDEKRYLQSLDIDVSHIIDFTIKTDYIKSIVMLETGGMGVDIVVDSRKEILSKTNDESNAITLKNSNSIISHHDIISCLAVGGKWITSKADLQLDPPHSRQLYLRCASVCFLFEQAWMLSACQQGRYQHILMDTVEKINSKVIRPNIHHTVAFDGLADFFNSQDDLRVGKVVVTV
ncbi:quinone oxidoreductase-like protein 1 [Bacillus rossius redtenbacheri]|uniref:quinone oxidoreductase-like protein 1 n=1 Tax=Bacillus rossius redtenbacheri TaxID=93214 RepID=UPI002FDE3A26